MWAAPRADYFVLQQPLAAPPGTVFNYNSGSTDLLGVILRKISGQRLDEFAAETLFDPLGIEDWEWDGSAGFNPSASAGLRLRPRDLAKIGQLVLERGKWHGRQIVSSSWIEHSTTPRRSDLRARLRPEGITSYGYLWWLGRSPPEHPERDMIAGAGYGGQRVFILPSLGAVVVTTAGLYAAPKISGLTALTTLNEFVFPAAVRH
jgi:CubicO group peptidase (beta-lactamase class C family)